MPLPRIHVLQLRFVSEVELKGSYGDVAIAQSRDVGVGMGFRAAQTRVGPEIDAPARIDAAVVFFQVGGEVLRRYADATNGALIETRYVDVEKRPGRRIAPQDALDDLASNLRAASVISALSRRRISDDGRS